tara:strand:+ start:260 stop:511 length:252 start_codon:yes stop_codon:yes gene_type:complete
MKRPNAHPKTTEQRREEGEERQALRETLSPFQQIIVLDNRLGIGEGAVKERKRLLYLMSEQKINKKPLTNKQRRTAKRKSRRS